MPVRKTTKKAKPKIVKVKATITIETAFAAYEKDSQNQKALSQIQGWITETLGDEEFIPLFVTTRSGEQTHTKRVKVTVQQLGKS